MKKNGEKREDPMERKTWRRIDLRIMGFEMKSVRFSIVKKLSERKIYKDPSLSHWIKE